MQRFVLTLLSVLTPGGLIMASSLNKDDLTKTQYSGPIHCLELPFERLNFGSIGHTNWKQWIPDTQYSVGADSLAVEFMDDGKRALRVQLNPTDEGSNHVQAGSKIAPNQTYRLKQSVYLETGWDWGGKNKGGKLGFGLGGGSTPTGGLVKNDGFTVRFSWRGNRDGSARITAYSYAADRTLNLPFGDELILDGFNPPINKWFDLMMEVRTNSSSDVSDGTLKAWANDRLLLEKYNIRWQSAGSKPLIDKLLFTTFYGGNGPTWAPERTTYVRFSDVCWSMVADNEIEQEG